MPNIITHKIFAEEVYKRTTKKDIKDVLEKHFQIYYIGSNGPDFLFFYHAKPWESYKNHQLNYIGSTLHKAHVNTFYDSAVKSIQKEKDAYTKESELAYLMGHLCHWSLDMMTHPYIFHRTGDCKGASAGLHHRFESMMDTMMLKRCHGLDIADYRSYEICEYDEEMLKAIARIYVPAVKDAMDEDIKVFSLREALDGWKDIQKLLYDPGNKKFPVLKGVEKVLRKPWAISGNIVPKDIDETYDILNEQHSEWIHPCDDTIRSTASFMELFEQAVEQAVVLLEKVYGCIEYDADVQGLLNLLQDRAYDTGMSGEKEMKYFNVIYDHPVKEDENETL